MHTVGARVQRRTKLPAVVIAFVLLLISTTPVLAVQFGEPDGEAHPHVGLLVFDVKEDGEDVPSHRCSGTLLAPKVMLTAGHCTFGASGGRVWFDADVGAGIPGNGYPGGKPGGASIEFAEIHTHPDFDDEAFYLADAGVVILSKPVKRETYGALPPVGLLDELISKPDQSDRSFTVVGYGLQSVVPTLQSDLVRHQGNVTLINVNGTAGIPAGVAATFTNNPGEGNGSGGTCFGDSGGPIFHGDSNVIGAITSYGLNANCAGTGGGYRVDMPDDHEFISKYLDQKKKK